ncbi:ABC transporter substrate-binding protein [Pseudonocardia phyllosphaerae]|uniref:ABC transporter substrate-binding protein n=1 Tax=Pseudonocardia phyllosphaerae TaxID=3390502 RepID=UPI003978E53E
MQNVSRRSFFSLAGGAAALAALTACGGGGGNEQGGAGGGAGAAGGPWEYTDDLGKKISLPQRPQKIVAYVNGAAALWDFGVRPAGLYGPSRDSDGKPNLQAGNMDLGQVQSIGGEDYNGVNLEKLAALNPDLMIASLAGETPDSRWVIKDDLAQIEKICPVYSIREFGKPIPEIIGGYQTLAERLGADVNEPGIATARDAFTKAGDELKAAVAEKKGLRAEFVYGDTDGFYVASPTFYPNINWYTTLGLTSARAGAPLSADFLEQLSWEQVGKYPSDLILTDIRTFSLPQQQMIKQFPTFAALPAVKAGQLGGWNGEPRFSYQGSVEEVRNLAAAVRKARPGIAK